MDMDMNPAWLTYPLQLEGSRAFECDPLTDEQCEYYKQHWHFWYVADLAFALPTVAFFASVIAVFTFKHVCHRILRHSISSRQPAWYRRVVGLSRYLSYRGVHVKSIGWNSASVGVLLLGFMGTVFFFCMDLIPQPYYWADEIFGDSPPLATRSGWLALACMPFVFATATKTNWITLFTGISYERLQVFHRWIAYAFLILALLHTFPFIVYHIHWQDMQKHFESSLLFYWTGIVALSLQAWLTFASHSSIRARNYELFKLTHFLAAAMFVVVFLWHCDATLTSWQYFLATAAIYVPCFVYPLLRTCFEYGIKQKAVISIEDDEFVRITIPAKFTWKPGQHCFLRFTGLGLRHAFSSHSFTICSSPLTNLQEPVELVFYVRRHAGFTARLYECGLQSPHAAVSVLVDGPYGGVNVEELNQAQRMLVIAGGSGAGWCLPFVSHFVMRSATGAGDVATRATMAPANGEKEVTPNDIPRVEDASNTRLSRLRVILATRTTGNRTWFEEAIQSLMSRHSTTAYSRDFTSQVFLIGNHNLQYSSQPLAGPSTTDINQAPPLKEASVSCNTSLSSEDQKGRPNLPQIIREEAASAAEAGESLSVYVCGPTTMQNDVRNVVAQENLRSSRESRGGRECICILSISAGLDCMFISC